MDIDVRPRVGQREKARLAGRAGLVAVRTTGFPKATAADGAWRRTRVEGVERRRIR